MVIKLCFHQTKNPQQKSINYILNSMVSQHVIYQIKIRIHHSKYLSTVKLNKYRRLT